MVMMRYASQRNRDREISCILCIVTKNRDTLRAEINDKREWSFRVENKKRINGQWLVRGIFLVILLCVHLPLKTGWGDDAVFAGNRTPLGDFLAERYRVWTSRLVLEAGVKDRKSVV